MKVEGDAVVKSATFRVFASNNWPLKIPYSTIPVKKLSSDMPAVSSGHVFTLIPLVEYVWL